MRKTLLTLMLASLIVLLAGQSETLAKCEWPASDSVGNRAVERFQTVWILTSTDPGDKESAVFTDPVSLSEITTPGKCDLLRFKLRTNFSRGEIYPTDHTSMVFESVSKIYPYGPTAVAALSMIADSKEIFTTVVTEKQSYKLSDGLTWGSLGSLAEIEFAKLKKAAEAKKLSLNIGGREYVLTAGRQQTIRDYVAILSRSAAPSK